MQVGSGVRASRSDSRKQSFEQVQAVGAGKSRQSVNSGL